MRKYLLLLLTTLLLQPFYAADHPKREIRAVWIMTFYGEDWPKTTATNEISRKRQQQELCDKLDMLQAANFNTVFLQVRLRGDVIYPSAIEPMNKVFSGKYDVSPGYDPLAFAIEECHKRGLECHAWFVTYPLGQGKKTAVKKRPELCKLHEKEWYLDPGMPGTTDYLLSLVKEVVTNYDIDGIQFDYIRYPEKAETFPDKDTYARYGNSLGLAAWRRDNINRTVTRIYDWVKQAKPWVQVSSSPLGKYNRIPRVPNAGWTSYETVHQDPQLWLKQGKHDMIAPMMYYKYDNFYPFVDNWTENTNGRLFISGLGTYRMRTKDGDWSLYDIAEQMEYLRKSNANGVAFFRASQVFGDTKGLYKMLKSKYFKYPALLPPLTWLSKERPEAPLNVRVERAGKDLKISWRKPTDTTQPLTYTIYYSTNGTVNPNRAENILATGIRDTEVYLTVNSEKEQEYSFRVTASSRYHIESKPSREIYYYFSRYSK
ncbi:uncharacterized lipoprotein YddW (UPF0748 family) [Parabacteroides sp. PF5-5]|uniref:glycoside hydrolase family 10 protein n=1 Tax=unclassified Parabacteroides TaxID=2649774 RepID=UPI002475FCA4|nr:MULTISPECIES: family 10 glycosylhydrolase [unclassified Parabacteroides]MDH6304138.1 uncharacterized lipoprotein YddW (UPF0748 family) [Parabacteroides sp. PH5-39]MDH6315162.1 uncharacterized lipoprotein YddW (UPF0748 family) [Parabacteroides sp. PF5-13]MDH6318807.1 uncharacterized lipoprotein YddW (UPF0748 family) [Parabacteroides sp. PH5-13]MDH6322536.1 uncharacterized lipoprotein YddW (UPF0748 family) [Parabacteroides sp. PH5-8]MDH6326312.1 uncharacterized lipoprotein YddW (UPF0748 famil